MAEVAWFGLCMASDTTSVLASVVILPETVSNVPCNTTFIGELPSGMYGTGGRVYLLDRVTFAIIGFSYNGEVPGMLYGASHPVVYTYIDVGLCLYTA